MRLSLTHQIKNVNAIMGGQPIPGTGSYFMPTMPVQESSKNLNDGQKKNNSLRKVYLLLYMRYIYFISGSIETPDWLSKTAKLHTMTKLV